MAAPARNQIIDFQKGTLVLLMVVYHWLNYFISPEGYFYRFIRFVTPSFIFITGFLISSALIPKYKSNPRILYKRLVGRGLRLVLLFTLLNVAVNALISKNYNGMNFGLVDFLSNVFGIYFMGVGEGTVFDILLPIGYLLCVTPVLLALGQGLGLKAWVVPIIVVSTIWLTITAGFRNGLVELMGSGFLGLLFGALAERKYSFLLRWEILCPLYMLHWIGLVYWNVSFSMQEISVCLNVWLILVIGRHLGNESRIMNTIAGLGRCSLFAYIGHIGILQILRRVLLGSGNSWFQSICALLLTYALLFFGVKVLRYGRARFEYLNRGYEVVFG